MRFYENDIVKLKTDNTEGKIVFSYKENGIRYYNVTKERAYIKCTAEDIELIERPATYDYIKKVDDINAYDKQMITKLYIAWELQPYGTISDEQIENLYYIYENNSDYNGITPFIHDIQDYLILNQCDNVQEYIDFIKD